MKPLLEELKERGSEMIAKVEDQLDRRVAYVGVGPRLIDTLAVAKRTVVAVRLHERDFSAVRR